MAKAKSPEFCATDETSSHKDIANGESGSQRRCFNSTPSRLDARSYALSTYSSRTRAARVRSPSVSSLPAFASKGRSMARNPRNSLTLGKSSSRLLNLGGVTRGACMASVSVGSTGGGGVNSGMAGSGTGANGGASGEDVDGAGTSGSLGEEGGASAARRASGDRVMRANASSVTKPVTLCTKRGRIMKIGSVKWLFF